MKYCPKCGFETDNNEFNICPECEEEVRLVEKRKPESNTVSDSTTSTSSVKLAGIASGGDTIITTNTQIKELSEAERIAKNKAAYLEKCEKCCKDGFISDDDLAHLEQYRESLGLERHFAEAILKDVKEKSIKKPIHLPEAAKLQIAQTLSAIERNDIHAISNDFQALKQWKSKHDNDELDQLYYQLKAIFEPNTYEIKDNDYWNIFWSCVAFKKIGTLKGVEALASLHRWNSFYPANNQTLLYTTSLLMDNRIDEAKESFKSVTQEFSTGLQALYDTLHNMLGREWYGETTDVPARLKFYSEMLFKQAYNALLVIAKQNHAERIAKEEEERRRKEAENYRREKFVESFEATEGDIDAACFKSGVTLSQYTEWLETIPEFAQAINAIKERMTRAIDELKAQEQAAIEKEKEITNKKGLFKDAYKRNKCDIEKSCYELGISSGAVRDWRSSDATFDEALKFIERQHREEIKKQKKRFIEAYKANECNLIKTCDDLGIASQVVSDWHQSDSAFASALNNIEKAKRQRERLLRFKKMLPYTLILILLGLIGLSVYNVREQEKVKEAELKEREAKDAAIKQYKELIIEFNNAIEHVNKSDVGLEALSNAANLLLKIRQTEQSSPYLKENKESIALTETINIKIQRLIDVFITQSSTVSQSGANTDGQKKLENVLSIQEKLGI